MRSVPQTRDVFAAIRLEDEFACVFCLRVGKLVDCVHDSFPFRGFGFGRAEVLRALPPAFVCHFTRTPIITAAAITAGRSTNVLTVTAPNSTPKALTAFIVLILTFAWCLSVSLVVGRGILVANATSSNSNWIDFGYFCN